MMQALEIFKKHLLAVGILGFLFSFLLVSPLAVFAQDYDESIPSWTNPEEDEEDLVPPPPPPPPEPFLEPQPDFGASNTPRSDAPSGIGSTGGGNLRGMGRYQGGNPSGVEFKRLKDNQGLPLVRPSKEERLKLLRSQNRKPKKDVEQNP